MGSYHGRYTFTTFSHEKSVLVRDFSRFGNINIKPMVMRKTLLGLENIWGRQDTRPMPSGKLTDWISWSKTEKFHHFSSCCPTLPVLHSELVLSTSTIFLCPTFYNVAILCIFVDILLCILITLLILIAEMGLIHYLRDFLPGAGGGDKALHGKVVLITGASRGIGRELAIQMHGLSMKVILAARNVRRLEELRKEPP